MPVTAGDSGGNTSFQTICSSSESTFVGGASDSPSLLASGASSTTIVLFQFETSTFFLENTYELTLSASQPRLFKSCTQDLDSQDNFIFLLGQKNLLIATKIGVGIFSFSSYAFCCLAGISFNIDITYKSGLLLSTARYDDAGTENSALSIFNLGRSSPSLKMHTIMDEVNANFKGLTIETFVANESLEMYMIARKKLSSCENASCQSYSFFLIAARIIDISTQELTVEKITIFQKEKVVESYSLFNQYSNLIQISSFVYTACFVRADQNYYGVAEFQLKPEKELLQIVFQGPDSTSDNAGYTCLANLYFISSSGVQTYRVVIFVSSTNQYTLNDFAVSGETTFKFNAITFDRYPQLSAFSSKAAIIDTSDVLVAQTGFSAETNFGIIFRITENAEKTVYNCDFGDIDTEIPGLFSSITVLESIESGVDLIAETITTWTEMTGNYYTEQDVTTATLGDSTYTITESTCYKYLDPFSTQTEQISFHMLDGDFELDMSEYFDVGCGMEDSLQVHSFNPDQPNFSSSGSIVTINTNEFNSALSSFTVSIHVKFTPAGSTETISSSPVQFRFTILNDFPTFVDPYDQTINIEFDAIESIDYEFQVLNSESEENLQLQTYEVKGGNPQLPPDFLISELQENVITLTVDPLEEQEQVEFAINLFLIDEKGQSAQKIINIVFRETNYHPYLLNPPTLVDFNVDQSDYLLSIVFQIIDQNEFDKHTGQFVFSPALDCLETISYNEFLINCQSQPVAGQLIDLIYTVKDDNSVNSDKGPLSLSYNSLTIVMRGENHAPSCVLTTSINQEEWPYLRFGLFYYLIYTCTDIDENDVLSEDTSPDLTSFEYASNNFNAPNQFIVFIKLTGEISSGAYTHEFAVTDDNSNLDAAGQKQFKETLNFFALSSVNHPPYFLKSLQSAYYLYVGESITIMMPGVADEDMFDTHQVFFEGLPNFCSTKEDDQILFVEPSKIEQIGEYFITYTAQDDNFNSCPGCKVQNAKIEFKIIIDAIPEAKVDQSSSSSFENEKEEEKQEELTTKEIFQFKDGTQFQIKPGKPSLKVQNLNTKGMLTLTFSHDMHILPELKDQVKEALNLEFKSDFTLLDSENQIVSWEAQSMSKRVLTIQVVFKTPELISQFQELDKIEVSVKKPIYFLSEETQQSVEDQSVILKEIPAQISNPERINKIIETTVSLQTATGWALLTNFFVNLALSGSMNLIWSVLNSLQIIVHFPILQFKFPQNVQVFSIVLMRLAQFDILPHHQINKFVFAGIDFNDEPESQSFYQAGFETSNFILNTGSIFWFFLLWAFLAIISLLLVYVQNIRLIKINEVLKKVVFYNMIIRIFLESYLELLICAFLNVNDLNFLSTSAERFSSFISCCLVAILVASPALAWISIKKFSAQLENREFVTKYGSFYSDLNTQAHGALMYNVFFLIRRFLFGFLLVFFHKFPVIQLTITTLPSLALILYTIRYLPFKESILNYIDIANESVILILSYLVWLFSDHSGLARALELKESLGSIYISIIIVMFAINISVLTYLSIIKPLRKLLNDRIAKNRLANAKNPLALEEDQTIETCLPQNNDQISQIQKIAKKPNEALQTGEQISDQILTINSTLGFNEVPQTKSKPKKKKNQFSSILAVHKLKDHTVPQQQIKQEKRRVVKFKKVQKKKISETNKQMLFLPSNF